MKEELKDLISKHLPSLAAGEMSKYIEQAEVDKKLLESHKVSLIKTTDELTTAKTKLKEFEAKEKALNDKETELNKKQSELDNQERNLKLTISELKLQESEKRASDAVNFVGMALRSPIYRKVISENDLWNSYWTNNQEVRHKTGTSKTVETQEL